MPTDASNRSSVFISYARSDSRWLDLLKTHLRPYIRIDQIDIWDDGRVRAGDRWQDEIRAALDRAVAAVLLVTPEFLASDFIADQELPRILREAESGGLRLLWVAVRESAWKKTPIADFQALNDPAKPLFAQSPAQRDLALKRIAEQIAAEWAAQRSADNASSNPPMSASPEACAVQKPTPADTDAGVLPEMSEVEAKRTAHAAVGGVPSVLRVWRDGTTSRFMAVAAVNDRACAPWVKVLEQCGHSFREIWHAEDLWREPEVVAIEDIDEDGSQEVLVSEWDHFSYGDNRRLTIYFPARRMSVRVVEASARGPAEPVAPFVTVEPEIDLALLQYVERAAIRHGYLHGASDFDLDSPEYAVQRWQFENPNGRLGRIAIHYYPGLPHLHGSETEMLEAGGYQWIGEFKGALYAYETQADRHFVVYSSEDIYGWPAWLGFHQGVLWFGLHEGPGVYSYEVDSQFLRRHDIESKPEASGRWVAGIDADRGVLLLEGDEAGKAVLALADLLAAPSKS